MTTTNTDEPIPGAGKTMERPTPETDAVATYRPNDDGVADFVEADFARRLERERDEARAEVARLREALPFLQAVVSALESDPTNEVEFTVGSLGIEHEGSIRKAIAAKEE